jgi:hypothetical protein
LKIDPSYYEAVANLARIYCQIDKRKAAHKIIEKAWNKDHSEKFAKLMLIIHQDAPIKKKAALMEDLISDSPESKAGYLVLADLYIRHDMITQARAVMDKLLVLHAPDFEMSKIMALIEAKSQNNYSIIINWLNKL